MHPAHAQAPNHFESSHYLHFVDTLEHVNSKTAVLLIDARPLHIANKVFQVSLQRRRHGKRCTRANLRASHHDWLS
jgi:hypothetical protein